MPLSRVHIIPTFFFFLPQQPERIRGWNYGVQSDVWSLGITLMELALGRFPLDAECKSLTILELLQHIVNEPLPTLPRRDFPEDFCNFVDIW